LETNGRTRKKWSRLDFHTSTYDNNDNNNTHDNVYGEDRTMDCVEENLHRAVRFQDKTSISR